MFGQAIVVLLVGVASFGLGAKYGKAAYAKAVAEALQLRASLDKEAKIELNKIKDYGSKVFDSIKKHL